MHLHLAGKTTIILFSAFFFFRCASPKPITGGPSDTTPPSIIQEESTPNQQVNFNADEITITFDEWISLKDVYNQLVISPPMPDEPEIKQKGKAIIIELPDSLRSNTTYTINFGNAIADLNEGNVLGNYVFVFSTGPVLDSINISGTVIDAVTLKPAGDVWVMLHSMDDDSAVYKFKPDYLARTSKEGTWSMSFLPADSFLVVALKDENVNFLYDQEAEYFGWLSERVYTGDPQGPLPPIYIFPREKRTIVKDVVHEAPGWLKLVVESPPPKQIPVMLPAVSDAVILWEGDTLHLWYPPDRNYAGYAVLNDDSTQVKISGEPSIINRPLVIKSISGRIAPGARAIFKTDLPIAAIDTSLISLQSDSLGSLPVDIRLDSLDTRKFSLETSWNSGSRNALIFLPGAVTDIWGRDNDTVRHSVVVSTGDQFGDLFMTIDGLDSTKQYVLLLKEGEQIIDTFVVEGIAMGRLVKRGLPPAKYTIEVIEDANRNKVWDTGNFAGRRQPERKNIFNPEGLRAGWEQEVKMTWK